jgi:hypothetical protein
MVSRASGSLQRSPRPPLAITTSYGLAGFATAVGFARASQPEG